MPGCKSVTKDSRSSTSILLTAQMAFSGRAMECHGAGWMSGTWTGGPCSGRSGLYCCVGIVMLEFPRAFRTFSIRTAASSVTAPRSRPLVAVSMLVRDARFAWGPAAEAAPRSTAQSAKHSMVPLHSIIMASLTCTMQLTIALRREGCHFLCGCVIAGAYPCASSVWGPAAEAAPGSDSSKRSMVPYTD